MRKSSLGLSTLIALAAAMSAPALAVEAAQVKTRPPSRTAQTGRSYRGIGNGYRYPDQSSRQAMRGMRRAQGGPGIKLEGGVYVACAA
jgi:hypothetical protein